MKQLLTEYINACFTGIWVQTYEPDEAEKEIVSLAVEKEWNIWRWDIARGWGRPNNGSKEEGNPLSPLKALPTLCQGEQTTVMILHNYHRFLTNPQVMQECFNRVISGKEHRCILIILSHCVQIPAELEKVFVTIEHQLPNETARSIIAYDMFKADGPTEQLYLDASAGLTRYEVEGAFALSLARHAKIKPDEVWELKASMLKKSGILEMHRGKESFNELGGLEHLKSFCTKALQTGRNVKPKGILLLGVPGTGKSAFAKALGNETGRPTLTLDIGSMFGSLVGQTEERIRQALKIADAMAPCILFVDEIEKALSGQGTNNDGGAATRMFGTLLSWLNDHESDVFFIGTCNDISKLPPEFSRAERFDGIFFLDFPTRKDRDMIWDQYHKKFGITDQQNVGVFDTDNNWTGAEIKACCRLSALLGVTLPEASQNIVPISITAANKVQSLREWASSRCLNASSPGIYNHQPQTTSKSSTRRKVIS